MTLNFEIRKCSELYARYWALAMELPSRTLDEIVEIFFAEWHSFQKINVNTSCDLSTNIGKN